MTMLGILDSAQKDTIVRWHAARRPPIRTFAPYFRHVYLVDLFFNLFRLRQLTLRRAYIAL
jgi:hypothetical protein